MFEISARKRLPKKFVLCASSSTRANPRVKKERKRERETTFVSSNLCTYGPYYVRTMVPPGTFAIYTFSLLVEIKKSLEDGKERQLFVLHQICCIQFFLFQTSLRTTTVSRGILSSPHSFPLKAAAKRERISGARRRR